MSCEPGEFCVPHGILDCSHCNAEARPLAGERETERRFAIGADRWPGVSKLMEETGEVQQVLGKLLATYGESEHWDGTNLCRRLEEELGDLLAAVDFFIARNASVVSESEVSTRRSRKLMLFNKWHTAEEPAHE